MNAGLVERYRKPPKYKLRGRPTTVKQAAERLGIPEGTLYSHLHNHRCGLAAAVAYYERKRQRRAEKEILEIIRGK